MSKFYYQGKVQQENFLTQSDIFLRSVYGKYQLMLFEAILLLLFAISSLVIYFLPKEYSIEIPHLYARIFGGCLVFLGIINLITYYFIIKKEYGGLMKVKAYLFLIIGLIILIFPITLESLLYRLMAFIFLSIGITTFMRRSKTTLYQKMISLLLIALGIFFIFSPSFNNSKDLIFFILTGILACYLLYNGIKFRKSLKSYEDEERGFTDFTIE